MAKNSSTGEPVNQAPGTSETTAEISTAATDTSETTAEIISTTPATTPAPAASENPTPAPDSATPASTAPEKTGKVETPAPANADQPDTAVDVRRQRVEELKKSLTSGSGSVATPTPGATETPEATSTVPTPEIAASETPTPAPDSTTPASTATAEDIRNDSGLPSGYLADGWTDEQGILRREYVEKYAEEIAEKLKGMRASTYHLAFLSEAKTLRKKKTPYSQQKLCTMQMATAAKKLTSRKKDPAPAILLEVIKAATEAVVDSETFQMLYLHLDAIYSYLLDN